MGRPFLWVESSILHHSVWGDTVLSTLFLFVGGWGIPAIPTTQPPFLCYERSPTESTEHTETLAENILPQISQNSQKFLLRIFSHRFHRSAQIVRLRRPPTEFTDLTEVRLRMAALLASVWICEICGRIFSAVGSVKICAICGRFFQSRRFCEFCEICGRIFSASLSVSEICGRFSFAYSCDSCSFITGICVWAAWVWQGCHTLLH